MAVSFAEGVCSELAGLPLGKQCCRKAMTAGFLLCALPDPRGKAVCLRLSRKTAADALSTLLTTVYGKEPEIARSGANGKRFWEFTITAPACVKLFRALHDGTPPLFGCENCRGALLRGAFLAGGILTDPQKEFHLEFRTPDPASADRLAEALAGSGYPPRRTSRGTGIRLYYKDGTSVGDLLSVMGAQRTAFGLYNTGIERDIRNYENRVTNCVTRNIQKAVAAAARQTEIIKRMIEDGTLDRLPEELRETARLRVENPDVTLDELGAMHRVPLSKSGLNHRLQKILAAAKEPKK